MDISKYINPKGMVLTLERTEDFEHSEARHDMLNFYDAYLRNFNFDRFGYINALIVTASFITVSTRKEYSDDFMSYKMIRSNNSSDFDLDDHFKRKRLVQSSTESTLK